MGGCVFVYSVCGVMVYAVCSCAYGMACVRWCTWGVGVCLCVMCMCVSVSMVWCVCMQYDMEDVCDVCVCVWCDV